MEHPKEDTFFNIYISIPKYKWKQFGNGNNLLEIILFAELKTEIK